MEGEQYERKGVICDMQMPTLSLERLVRPRKKGLFVKIAHGICPSIMTPAVRLPSLDRLESSGIWAEWLVCSCCRALDGAGSLQVPKCEEFCRTENR